MIQRIQSLYILIATVLIALTAFMPLMDFISMDGDCQFTALGILQGENIILKTIPLLILLLAATLFNAMAFFSFKNRMLQIRFLVFSIVLHVCSYGLGAYYLLQIKDSIMGATSKSIAMTFPLISAILIYLAIRSIGKDEALVKSLDRIR